MKKKYITVTVDAEDMERLDTIKHSAFHISGIQLQPARIAAAALKQGLLMMTKALTNPKNNVEMRDTEEDVE